MKSFARIVMIISAAALFVCGASCDRVKRLMSSAEPQEVTVPVVAPEVAPTPEPEELPPPPPPVVESPEMAVDTTSQVAVLGYHGFTEDPQKVRDMWIHVDKFRSQMRTLKENKIPVIPMKDFLAWRRGEKNIPSFSVVITMDDGWKSTHSLALPVLKEYGFPFTVYLYPNFFGGAGKTLSKEELDELVAAGAEVGCHSLSHQDMRNKRRRTADQYATYLKAETEGARRLLKEKTGYDTQTFAYPYGAYNEDVVQATAAAGFVAMLTVKGQKVDWETDLKEVGRYIVHGKDDRIFSWAISSNAPGGLASGNNLMNEKAKDEGTGMEVPLVMVSPENGAVIRQRQPKIMADLSRLEGIDAKTIEMRVSGIGMVPPSFDEATKVLSYQINQRLRLPEYWVQIQFKRVGQARQDVLRWKFAIDAVANYIPENWSPPAPEVEAVPVASADPTS